MSDSATPVKSLPAAHQAPLSSTISRFAQIVHWIPDAISSSATLFLLQSSPASESYIRWPKYWSFSFSISPSNEYSGLISFRIVWFDLAAQGTQRAFPSTTIQKHQFFGTQPSLWSNSHLCITTGKTIALTIRTFNILCGLGLKKRGGPTGRRPGPNALWAALRPPTVRLSEEEEAENVWGASCHPFALNPCS